MLTAQEAYALGLPGTYMNGEYFPALYCMRCVAFPEDRGRHDGCVWKYWGDAPWIPGPEELDVVGISE